MGAANVEPAPLTVPPPPPPPPDVSLLLLLPHAATASASTAAATSAIRFRDLKRSPFLVCPCMAARLAGPWRQSVIDLWRRCEKAVKGWGRTGIRSRNGCG